MFRVFVFAALALVLCPANGSAELVNNVIDDFSNPASASATGISRTQTAGASFVGGTGFFFTSASGPSISSISYSANTGTLGSIDVDFANGVSFSTSMTFAPPNTFTVRAYGGNGVDPDNQVGVAQFLASVPSPVTFNNDFSSFKTLRFSVEGSEAGVAALGGT